ncbi:MAG: phosphoribosyl-AMP cyclohydrolase [Bacteroidetes bacterium]|jgi:phosphoribosyl-AMP cyclohydrolase|nr:phosphoribosyl-AMP cyclohydrolase [Bacteroidota bacterium]
MSPEAFVENVRFDDDGLVPVIVQDAADGQVLMLAYMNAETLRQTLTTGRMTYWSRSRQEVWVKGATSGHTQEVVEARIDCDGDTLLFTVHQRGGAACHTGHRSCFYRRWEGDTFVRDGTRIFDPEDVYGPDE